MTGFKAHVDAMEMGGTFLPSKKPAFWPSSIDILKRSISEKWTRFWFLDLVLLRGREVPEAKT